MKKIFLPVCFFLSLSFSPSLNLFSQSPVRSKKIVIIADKGWQNSDVVLKKGQFYSISAWGSWSSGFETQSTGPEGKGYGTINDWPLVGWIAGKQPPRLSQKISTNDLISKIIFIGKGKIYKSYAEGILWFSMGEWSGCKECSGQMEVLIMIYD